MSKICPGCNSSNICRIMYGLPDFSPELQKDIEEGKLTLGGCVVSEESPKWHCNDCDNDF